MSDLLLNCLLFHGENVVGMVRSRSDLFASAACNIIPLGSPVSSSHDDESGDKMDEGQDVRAQQRTSTQLLLILEQLADQVNPIAAILALQLQIPKLSTSSAESFVKVGQRYLMFRDQEGIRSIISEVTEVSAAVTRLACSTGRSKQIVRTLRQLASVVAPNPFYLTPIHADFLQACISGHLYGVALNFLKTNIFVDIDQEKTSISAQDVFRFYYYAGICYIAEKNFSKASECFDMIISAPANALSLIVVDAMKKAKLVSLIAQGEKYSCPKNVSSAVQNFFRSPQVPYDDIAKLFVEDDFGALREAVLMKKEALDRDNNYGLAKQVLEAWKSRRLSQLSQVYVTLPLQRVAEELVVEDVSAATSFLLKSTKSDIIACKINADNSMIKFGEDSDSTVLDAKKKLLNEKLGQAMMETTVFSQKMRELQKAAITSSHYVMKNTSGGGSSVGVGASRSWIGASIAAGAMDVEY